MRRGRPWGRGWCGFVYSSYCQQEMDNPSMCLVFPSSHEEGPAVGPGVVWLCRRLRQQWKPQGRLQRREILRNGFDLLVG